MLMSACVARQRRALAYQSSGPTFWLATRYIHYPRFVNQPS